jgi:hypothetical protein
MVTDSYYNATSHESATWQVPTIGSAANPVLLSVEGQYSLLVIDHGCYATSYMNGNALLVTYNSKSSIVTLTTAPPATTSTSSSSSSSSSSFSSSTTTEVTSTSSTSTSGSTDGNSTDIGASTTGEAPVISYLLVTLSVTDNSIFLWI